MGPELGGRPTGCPSLEGSRARPASEGEPAGLAAMLRYAPAFTVDTMEGVGHAGILLRRVEDFDARLRRIIERFEALKIADAAD